MRALLGCGLLFFASGAAAAADDWHTKRQQMDIRSEIWSCDTKLVVAYRLKTKLQATAKSDSRVQEWAATDAENAKALGACERQFGPVFEYSTDTSKPFADSTPSEQSCTDLRDRINEVEDARARYVVGDGATAKGATEIAEVLTRDLEGLQSLTVCPPPAKMMVAPSGPAATPAPAIASTDRSRSRTRPKARKPKTESEPTTDLQWIEDDWLKIADATVRTRHGQKGASYDPPEPDDPPVSAAYSYSLTPGSMTVEILTQVRHAWSVYLDGTNLQPSDLAKPECINTVSRHSLEVRSSKAPMTWTVYDVSCGPLSPSRILVLDNDGAHEIVYESPAFESYGRKRSWLATYPP